ncbi:MAG TPA: hypothetical protein VFQ61_02855 [Polyangiaceae bacterium]|nr:hypothetical protein [Polyangiaceae bacterium]
MSVWKVEELRMPPVHVTLAPPPPEPPPFLRRADAPKPAGGTAAKTPKLLQPTPHRAQTPAEPEPTAQNTANTPDASDTDASSGVPGGDPSSTQTWLDPPPAPTSTPQRVPVVQVTPQIARHLLLVDPNVEPYRVPVPRALQRSGVDLSQTIVKLCADARGAVTQVTIVKGGIAAIDAQLPTVLRRWRYRPMRVDGTAVDFCYVFRYDLR